MSKNYTQLSEEQRYQIEVLLKTGEKQKSIASLLGVSNSTISRELKRNSLQKGLHRYRAITAHEKTKTRHRKKPKRIKFTGAMKIYIANSLEKEKYSPELISATGKERFGDFVSHERIYQWIWKSKYIYKRADRRYRRLYQHLRHGRHRQNRGHRKERRGIIIPNRKFIDKRPKVVAKRKRLGDYEIDLMLGKDSKGALLVMTDRSTLQTKLRKLASRDSVKIKRAILNCASDCYWIKTMTFDNDRAFSLHEQIAKTLKVQTYFTNPYSSQEKGTVENRIGVLRRFFPKRTNLAQVTHQQIKSVENKLNTRPVRKFNYKTPNQVFSEKIALIT